MLLRCVPGWAPGQYRRRFPGTRDKIALAAVNTKPSGPSSVNRSPVLDQSLAHDVDQPVDLLSLPCHGSEARTYRGDGAGPGTSRGGVAWPMSVANRRDMRRTIADHLD